MISAAWKIIKSWLPGKTAELVKFVSRSDLKEWIPVSEQLKEWGGKVEYKFAFEPEPIPAPVVITTNEADNRKKVGLIIRIIQIVYMSLNIGLFKVTFAEDAGNGDITRKLPIQGRILTNQFCSKCCRPIV